MSDPEIEAMAAVSSAFSTLEDDARGRVLRWAADKYGVPYVGMVGSATQIERSTVEVNSVEGKSVDETASQTAESATYEHFADLYAAAAPTTKQTRVLVAAYWFQKVKGQDTFQSFDLNRELKHLGHYVDHIAEALSANVNKKPQLVLQVRKNGSKGRKTYKLSGEGIKVVESMITLGVQR
ncbi:hypothetical protein [Streptomyces sp. NPDC057375]|uniref:hypothetical protein n=1 Tax=Streptomyces sp. NPDC057375 TaxID=3346109 RepID=UPI00362CF2C8